MFVFFLFSCEWGLRESICSLAATGLQSTKSVFFPLQHTDRSRFPASLAFGCDQSTEFRPMECGRKWCISLLGLTQEHFLCDVPLSLLLRLLARCLSLGQHWQLIVEDDSLHQPGSLNDSMEFLLSLPPWTLNEKEISFMISHWDFRY